MFVATNINGSDCGGLRSSSTILENLRDIAVHKSDGEVNRRLLRSAYVLVIRLMTRLFVHAKYVCF